MSAKRKTLMQGMDALVWWSGTSDKVRHDMSADADERQRLPMRWLPLLPMAFAAALLYTAVSFPVSRMVYGIAVPIMAVASAIAINGPLGKPSIDDDEREAALRKNAFFFCTACLAFLNIIAGPILLLTSALHGWTVERSAGAAFALFMANMTCFVSLPTLYASWKLPRQPESES